MIIMFVKIVEEDIAVGQDLILLKQNVMYLQLPFQKILILLRQEILQTQMFLIVGAS